jgi:DNA anti-recombination protein RmuC
LKNELGGISQSLVGAVTTIQSFQQQTLKDLQQFANSLDTTLQNFQGGTKGVLEQVGTELNRSVAQSILGMEAQRTAFEESATQVSSTFRGIREDLQLALTTQATEQKAMLDAITSQTQAILQEANSAFQSQSTTLQTVGIEAANLMDTAKENLSSTLTNIDTTLQNTRQTVQDELENFRIEYQTSLNTFFDRQNNLLNETLGKQREGLSEVVASLQQTFNDEAEKRQQMSQEVDKSMANIIDTIHTVNNMASALGLSSSERLGTLQEISRTIGGEAHRVEKAYQNMTNQFEIALDKGNKELSGYLSTANESYSNYFKDFDFATAQVYKELNSTSGELLKAAQCLLLATDRQNSQETN